MVKTTILKFFFFTYFEDFYEIKPMLIFFFFFRNFMCKCYPQQQSGLEIFRRPTLGPLLGQALTYTQLFYLYLKILPLKCYFTSKILSSHVPVKASLKPYPESTKIPRNTNFDNLNSNYIGLHPFFLQHILFLCRTLGFLQEIELECEKTQQGKVSIIAKA